MSAETIAIVRENVAEPDDTGGWTDARIQAMLDKWGEDTNAASANIWSVKAADSAVYVDVTENGSSRKMSEVHKNALAMTAFYRGLVTEVAVETTGRPRTRPIVRP